MPEFSADLTNPPDVDTGDPSGTLMAWVGYAIVFSMVVITLGFASNTITPLLGSVFDAIPGVSTGRGGIPVQRVE
jgi:hypothetical protein